MNPADLACACGHDGYAHGLPGSGARDTGCDRCDCPTFQLHASDERELGEPVG